MDLASGATTATAATTTTSSFLLYFSRNTNHNHRHNHLVVRSGGGGGRRRRNNVPPSKHHQQDSAGGGFLSSKSKNTLRESEIRREMEFLWRPTTATTSIRCRMRRRNTLREKLPVVPPQTNNHQDPHHENAAIEEDEGIQGLLEVRPVGKSCLTDTLPIMRGMSSSSLKALPSAGAGVGLLCTLCVLGAMAKLFSVSGRAAELKREEVDMLRRKKKSRMDKGELDIGGVTVLQSGPSPLAATGARPQLDRNELMNCIEISGKSRQNQGLELHDSAPNDEGRTGDGLESLVPASNDHTVARNADGHETDASGALKHTPTAAENSARGSNSDTLIHLNASRNEGIEQNVIGTINFMEEGSIYTASGKSQQNQGLELQDSAPDDEGRTGDGLASLVPASNDRTAASNVDGHETDASGSLKHTHSSAESSARGSNSDTLIHVNASRNEGIEQNVIGTINFMGEGSSYTASGKSQQNQGLELQDSAPDDERRTRDGLESLVPASNDRTAARNADGHETDTSGSLKHTHSSAESSARGSNSDTMIHVNASRNEGVEQNVIGTINFMEEGSSYTASGTSSSIKRVPKILKSVKKAKEYLLEKHGISADKLCTGQDVQLKGLDAGASAHARSSDDNKVAVKTNLDLPHDIHTGIPEELSTVSVVAHPSLVDDLITDSMEYPSRSFPGTITAEKPCSEAIKSNGFNVERRSIENQSVRDNDTNSLYTCNDGHGLESQGFSCVDSSSVAHSVGGRRVMGDNVADNSKQSNNSLDGYADSEEQVKTFQDAVVVCNGASNRRKVNEGRKVVVVSEKANSADPELPIRTLKEHRLDKVEFDANASQLYPIKDHKSVDVRPLILDSAQGSGEKPDIKGLPWSTKSIQGDSAGPDNASESLKTDSHGNWIEDNFQKFDPIINAVGTGFRENYMLAKEKVQQSVISTKISELGLLGEDEELEWMKDEKLSEIVFQVRDNELAGRDPFHLMDAVDQESFFKGLELKADKVNEKLLNLHEWVHSRIGNLDYGADGISLYDPLEKIVPFWKGPTLDKELESVNKFTKHQMAQTRHSLPKSEKSPNSKDGSISLYSSVDNGSPNEASTSEKTLIECSDGSKRVGKKTGKEQWQHTKKWSRGFLEVYNTETDPEIKSIMKDMGKDLDKWITEKEIQEAADVMTRMPKKKQRYIQKKIDKLKREVEMYGAGAVISKYIEYSDEKEEDNLWWLDLQFVLCIELYMVDDGVPKIGFYSLEMATDLELHPAQYHVIGFEDPGDSKNLCYIIQAHMDIIGSGRAFVVARPPKEVFREAKAKGFNVTVVKKGELTLNVDQTLDEVEEEITEIGSKIYHDKVMKDRGVDIRTLMDGVVRADKASRRKPKGMLMRSGKS